MYAQGTVPPRDGDPDLSDTIRLKALAAALPIKAVWWRSPLKRCQKTADALKMIGTAPMDEIIIDALREQEYGQWHDRPVSEIWDQLEDSPQSNWHFLHPTVRPPDGESFEDLIIRLEPIIEAITTFEGDNLVIITHAMVVRALIGMALGMNSAQSLALSIDTLSHTTLTYLADEQAESPTVDQWFINRLNQCY